VSTFKRILNRVQRRLDGWNEKFLSQAGREILLKAVVQAIPTYNMSVFQLPKNLCRSLSSIMTRFWWGNQSNKSKASWMSWNRLGLPKSKGGMGFRNIEVFNTALLAKQGWRILQAQDSLVRGILKEKYFPQGSFLQAQLGRNPSYAWLSIFNARKVLERGLMWRVGNGDNIQIWQDKWIPKPTTYKIQSPSGSMDPLARVNTLIDLTTGWWNYTLIQSSFAKVEADMICSLPLSPLKAPDKMVWLGTKSGFFTVRSAYHMEMQRSRTERGESSRAREQERMWKLIWELQAPPMLKHFTWKLCHGILAAKSFLHCKGILITDPSRPLCNYASESIFHVVWSCPATMAVWQEASIFVLCVTARGV
jgi:hypothetical protein